MAEVAVIGDYDIRDKKLADAKSKSSVATTDSIRMKDTKGNEVYIARDSFVDAVRSALGPILTNMTQKTAASGGVVVNDSNDVGTMNLSNLASVLSAYKGNILKYQYISAKATSVNLQTISLPYGIINTVNDIGYIDVYTTKVEGNYKTLFVKTDIAVETNTKTNTSYIVIHPTQEEVDKEVWYHINIIKP